jgi:hypothetical protein
MNTAPTEQVPAAAQAAETPSPATVSAGVDNVTGAELVAAFKSRRVARDASPAPVQTSGEQKPAESAPPVTPVPAESAPASDIQSQAASAPDSDSQPPVAPDGAVDELAIQPAVEASAETEQTETEGKGIHAMQARIDKLTARLRDAERKLEDAGTKSAPTASEPTPAPVTGVEFGHDPEVQQLTTEITREKAMADWCAKNPDGGEVAGKDGRQYFISAEDAQAYRAAAEERLADLRAGRATRVQQLRQMTSQVRQNSEAHISQTFAWAKQEASPENEMLRNIENLMPAQLRQAWPGWKTVAAYGIDAIAKAREQQAKPVPVNVKAPVRPPKVAPAAGSTAPRVNPSERQLAEAQAAYEKNPNAKNFQRVSALRHEARKGARPE